MNEEDDLRRYLARRDATTYVPEPERRDDPGIISQILGRYFNAAQGGDLEMRRMADEARGVEIPYEPGQPSIASRDPSYLERALDMLPEGGERAVRRFLRSPIPSTIGRVGSYMASPEALADLETGGIGRAAGIIAKTASNPISRALDDAGAGFIPGVGDAAKAVGKAVRRSVGNLPAPRLERNVWEGRVGDMRHLTAKEEGFVPTEYIADLQGARGEIRGQHRNRQGKDWEDFKKDIQDRGIQQPIFIVSEPGFGPRIYNGNHRLDAALELGLSEVPIEVRYFGKQEDMGFLEDLYRKRTER